MRVGKVVVVECERANEFRLRPQFLEAVEHEDALATAGGPNVEARAVRGKRIGTDGPALSRVDGWTLTLVIAIVHDQLEQPLGLRQIGLHQPRGAVRVLGSFEITVGRADRFGAIEFTSQGCVDIAAVFSDIFIKGRVALVVKRLAQQPGEDSRGVGRIGDSARGGLAVEGADVVAGDRTPERISGIVRPGPALDAGKEAFDSRPVPV